MKGNTIYRIEWSNPFRQIYIHIPAGLMGVKEKYPDASNRVEISKEDCGCRDCVK